MILVDNITVGNYNEMGFNDECVFLPADLVTA